MGRWFLIRLLWLLLTLLGVTFVTFFVLDRAPIDRAEIEATAASEAGSFADVQRRNEAVQRLRVRYGLLDPETMEPYPLWRRYAAWLGNAATMQLAHSRAASSDDTRRSSSGVGLSTGFLDMASATTFWTPGSHSTSNTYGSILDRMFAILELSK